MAHLIDSNNTGLLQLFPGWQQFDTIVFLIIQHFGFGARTQWASNNFREDCKWCEEKIDAWISKEISHWGYSM